MIWDCIEKKKIWGRGFFRGNRNADIIALAAAVKHDGDIQEWIK